MDSKNRSFSSREKETGFDRLSRPIRRNPSSIAGRAYAKNVPPAHFLYAAASSVWPPASHHGSRKKSFLLTVHRTVRPPGEGPPYAGAVFTPFHPRSGPFPSGKALCAEFFWQNRNFSFTLRPGYDNLLWHAKCHAAQAPRFGTQPALTRGFSPARYAAPRANQMKGGISHDP